MSHSTPQPAKDDPHGHDRPLLTVASVRDLKNEIQDLIQLQAELPAKIEAKKKLLDAALLFVPQDALPDLDLTPNNTPAESKISWTTEIARYLQKVRRGVSHGELMDAMQDSPVWRAVVDPKKRLYSSIGRMADRGEIKKVNGLLFDAKVAEDLRVSGKLDEVAAARSSNLAELVLGALQANSAGLTGPEILDHLRRLENPPPIVKSPRGTYLYAVLAGLIDIGKVIKVKNGYVLAGNESSNDDQASGSLPLEGGEGRPALPDVQQSLQGR